jgi:integrase
MNWEAVYARHLSKKLSPATLYNKINSLKVYLKHVDNPRSATNSTIADFAEKTLKKSAPGTKVEILYTVKDFYRKVFDREIDVSPYTAGLQANEIRYKPIIALNEKEAKTLYTATDNIKYYFLIRTCLLLGLLPANVRRIRLKDVHDDKRVIKFWSNGFSHPLKVSSEWVKDYIKYLEIFQPKEFLFEGHIGSSLSKSVMWYALSTTREKSTLKKHVTFKTLRYTMALMLSERGFSDESVAEALMVKDIANLKKRLGVITTKA